MAETKPLTAYWMHDVIRITEPLTIGKHAWRLEPVQKRTFVIAHDHGLEAVLDPQERLGRVRTAVDQIAEPEEAVGSGVKAKLAHCAVQGAKAAVHVAHNEIPAGDVDAEPDGGVTQPRSSTHQSDSG